MYRKKNIVMIVMMAAVLFMAVGYAIFSSTLNISGTSDLIGSWDIEISSVTYQATGKAYNINEPQYTNTTVKFDVGVKVPGDKMTFTVVVVNNGNIDAKLESIDANVDGTDVIKYSISGIQEKEILKAGQTKTFTVVTEFDINATQIPSDPVKDLTIKLNYVQDDDITEDPSNPNINDKTTTITQLILKDNLAQSDASIDFSQASSDTNGKGLYYTSTNTEGNQKTYYFRGAVTNNYVEFAGFFWRIVRINEDGSVRLIYQGKTADATGDATIIGKSVYNEVTSYSYLDNAHVGYMYGLTGLTTELSSPICVTYDSKNNKAINSTSTYSTKTTCENAGGKWATTAYEATHANIVESKMKKYLDSWYERNLKENYSSYIVDAGFCNDRSISSGTGYGSSYTYYGTMQFDCLQENDLFTTSASSKGNNELKYPIGLITANEVYRSGMPDNGDDGSNSYIVSGIDDADWWITMSPAFAGNGSHAFVYGIFGSGLIHLKGSIHMVHENQTVRPVINIKGDTIVTKGNGTINNPYSITNFEEHETLVEAILNDNNEQSDTTINVGLPSSYTPYTESHATSTSSTTFTATTSYAFGSSYTFDEATGSYKLSGNITYSTWQSVSRYSYPYTCKTTYANSTCSTLYKMSSYTNTTTGTGYAYTSTFGTSAITNGKGLYYTSSNTEDNKTTYYFRGAVDNNYVQLGKDSDGNDILWRIVRINEDGSVRIVTQDEVGYSAFNTSTADNAYVGYMYGTIGSSSYGATHSNNNPSTMKTYLDNWYVNNLSNYSNYLANAGFCNDRSVAPTAKSWFAYDTALGYGGNMTVYGSYNRYSNTRTPQFKCPQNNDLFTTSSSTKGNKALTYSIGLLTLDEVAYAGGGPNSQMNTDSYLTNGNYYWTMSPYEFYGVAEMNVVHYYGHVFNDVVAMDSAYGVRPVINLKGNLEVTGNGTSTDPYVILTN